MYAFRFPGEVSQPKNEALRAYARLEYQREDVAWLLASSRRPRRIKVARPAFRLFARRAARSHAPVAHKGAPRLSPEEAAAPA